MVAFGSSTDKHFYGDVSTMRTTSDDQSCEERRSVLELHQISTVSRNTTESRRLPGFPCTRIIKTASHLDRQNEDVWHGVVKARRLDLSELCAPANSPMAAAMSAAGHQSTQLRYWNGFDLAARRGIQRAFGHY